MGPDSVIPAVPYFDPAGWVARHSRVTREGSEGEWNSEIG